MGTFEYLPLDLGQPSFRLLRLFHGTGSLVECDIFHAWLYGDSAVCFEALSYTWGSMDLVVPIRVNGKDLSVTENLFFALRNLRSPVLDRVLWVDAVCIDQKNLKERSHQVQQMGKIYSQADRVVFWLGRSTEQTDILMRSLKWLEHEKYARAHSHQESTDEGLPIRQLPTRHDTIDQIPTLLDSQYRDLERLRHQQRIGMEELLSRPWFQRVWILQEVVNARKAIVACGSMEVNARIFALAPARLNSKISSHSQAVLDIMPGQSRANSWWNQKSDLYTLLLKFKESKASDARDMIYALIDISSDDGNSIQADYTKSEAQLVNDATSALFHIA